jgi:hypothetical protein
LCLAVVKNKLVEPSVTSSLLIVPFSNLEFAALHFKISLFCIPVTLTSLKLPIVEFDKSTGPIIFPCTVKSPVVVKLPVIVPPVAPLSVSTVVDCA